VVSRDTCITEDLSVVVCVDQNARHSENGVVLGPRVGHVDREQGGLANDDV
jgi:hypothetical protein